MSSINEEVVIVTMTSILLPYALSVVACKVLWPWHGEAKGLLAQCCARCCCRRWAKELKDEKFERKVRDEMRKRRVERAGKLLGMISLFVVYYCCITLWGMAAGSKAMRLQQTVIIQAHMFIKMTVAFFPKRLTPRVIDAIYLMTIGVIGYGIVIMGPATLAAWRATRLLKLLFWSVFDLKPWLNAFATFALLSAEIFAVARIGGAFRTAVIPILVAYFSVFLAIVGINYCLEQGVRFEILATDSKRELTAVQTLLQSICDVVVNLDGKLRMKKHSPQLAGVLLQPSHRSLEGADLREYMVSDADRKAFSENLSMSDGNTAQAAVFHAKLRDSTNGSVAMEFFTVDFKSHDGCQHHIVGMREHTDIQPLATQQRELAPPPQVEVRMPRARQADDQERPQLHGTPRALERWDLGALRSRSPSGSVSSRSDDEELSDTGSSLSFSLHAGIPGPRELPAIETSEIAKVVTTNYLLMSWVLGAARRSCCPKHAAIASLQRVAATLAKQDCMPDYGAVTEGQWQCWRCGIRAEEHRDPTRKKRKQCRLCKDLPDTYFGPGADGGARSTATL